MSDSTSQTQGASSSVDFVALTAGRRIGRYEVVSVLGQGLQTSRHNYVIRFRRAHAAGTTPTVPRVAELLADSAFRRLDDWLRLRNKNVVDVQAVVDDFLEQARQAALEQE